MGKVSHTQGISGKSPRQCSGLAGSPRKHKNETEVSAQVARRRQTRLDTDLNQWAAGLDMLQDTDHTHGHTHSGQDIEVGPIAWLGVGTGTGQLGRAARSPLRCVPVIRRSRHRFTLPLRGMRGHDGQGLRAHHQPQQAHQQPRTNQPRQTVLQPSHVASAGAVGKGEMGAHGVVGNQDMALIRKN